MKFQSLNSNSQIRFLLETLARTQEEVSSAAANSLLRYQTIFRFAVVIQLVLFFFYLSRSPWASLHPLTKLSWSSSGSGDAIFRQSRWTKFSRVPVHISVTKRANVLRSSLCVALPKRITKLSLRGSCIARNLPVQYPTLRKMFIDGMLFEDVCCAPKLICTNARVSSPCLPSNRFPQ